jgi:hypothetical protein
MRMRRRQRFNREYGLMKDLFSRFTADESGVTAIEYGLTPV